MSPRTLFVVLFATLLASPAFAGDASKYAGTWTFDESAGDRAAADAAVESLASEYAAIIRGLVRGRLQSAVKISETLTLAPGDDSMTITSQFSKWTSDLSGTEVAVVNPEGETVLLKRWLDGGVLHAVGSRGSSEQGFVFRLEDGGKTLILEVETRNPRLKRPLAYSLTYRKSD